MFNINEFLSECVYLYEKQLLFFMSIKNIYSFANYDTAIIQGKEKYRENIPIMINLRLFVVELFYSKFPFSAHMKSGDFFQYLDHSF